MAVVTDIRTERVKRRRERVVYVDGEIALTITEETFLRVGLRVGQMLNTDRLREIETSDRVTRAREQALRLLDHRPRTRREIEQRLMRNGWDATIVAHVVQRLIEGEWIDDARYARLYAEEQRRLRLAGATLIRRELRRKGVEAELIEAALQEGEDKDDEPVRAYELLSRRHRRYEDLDARTAERRMAGLLERRGFDGETIYSVVQRILNEMKEQNP